MTDDKPVDPGKRMRDILTESEGDSPISRLPRASDSFPGSPPIAETQAGASPQSIKERSVSPYKNLKFGPPFWTVTGILSLLVNGVLIAVLILLVRMLGAVQDTDAGNLGTGLVSGLYSNFEKMDRAHIVTEIPISTEIPVQFDLQINTQTNVVLSQDVPIQDAQVTMQTGGLEILSAPTDIVLPAGTNLPINLTLTVPVDQRVPVFLNVPVDIPLAQTDLHEPFVGLQEVVKPLYCVIKPTATNLDNELICR